MNGALADANRRLVTTCLLIVAVLCCASGCGRGNRAAAQRLAQAGALTADELADYYNALARDAYDNWEMSALRYGIDKSHPQEDLDRRREAIQQTLHSLKARADLAHSISLAYKALNELATYDASADMAEAASALGKAIGSIPILPMSGVSPADLFGAAGAQLGAYRQTRDLKQGANALLQIVCALTNLFNKESGTYLEIERLRFDTAAALIDELARTELAIPKPVIAHVTGLVGFTWTDDGKIACRPGVEQSLKEMAKKRAQLLEEFMTSATDHTLCALSQLSQSSNTFVITGNTSTIELANATRKAQRYLNDAASIHDGK